MKKEALYASGWEVVRWSGRSPLTVRRHRDRKRVSSANSPAVGAAMSPRSSQTQNVEPSRIVSATDRSVVAGSAACEGCRALVYSSEHGGGELGVPGRGSWLRVRASPSVGSNRRL